MRRSRQFRPLAPAPLEDRVVLSQLVHVPAVHPKAHPVVMVVKPGHPSPDNVIQGSVGNFHGRGIAQTVKAGDPVYEQITTRYADKTTQTESRLISPDKGTGTVTTTSTFNLRNSAGYSKVVDVATTTGATVNHKITTTLPGGAIETETRTELMQGDKTLVKGAITLPGGSIKTYTGTVTVSGNKATTDETFVDPEGFSTKVLSVVTVRDELNQSTTSTTTYPDGTSTTSDSNTFVLRLQPPTL